MRDSIAFWELHEPSANIGATLSIFGRGRQGSGNDVLRVASARFLANKADNDGRIAFRGVVQGIRNQHYAPQSESDGERNGSNTDHYCRRRVWRVWPSQSSATYSRGEQIDSTDTTPISHAPRSRVAYM